MIVWDDDLEAIKIIIEIWGADVAWIYHGLAKAMTETIIKENFPIPVNGRTEFYFGSLAAIFEMFTADDIGCRLETLWASGISEYMSKATRNCVISKHAVYRKSHKNK